MSLPVAIGARVVVAELLQHLAVELVLGLHGGIDLARRYGLAHFLVVGDLQPGHLCAQVLYLLDNYLVDEQKEAWFVSR